ncbi:hypothetical protein BLS_001240 [Venturia inaequalis]|uniref:Uncharacterized protein n=1 Tax=Venturia inaequalis TaxID=5025 RepID=A0A8H3YXG1_VENIN|nr:hypothetical protein EG328_008523 [Venturia inaequalis]KAE9977620.1 hypothetical protein BLS_001240 [Venturia inaequalis]KAE9991202.1 hypothetical protein EG327_000323 [Venturia inaequalis]
MTAQEALRIKARRLADDAQASRPNPRHNVQHGLNGAPAVAPTPAFGSFAAAVTSASSPSPSSSAELSSHSGFHDSINDPPLGKTVKSQKYSNPKRKNGFAEDDNDDDSPGPPPKTRVSGRSKLDSMEKAKLQIENGLGSLLQQHYVLQKKTRVLKARLRKLGEGVSDDDSGDE